MGHYLYWRYYEAEALSQINCKMNAPHKWLLSIYIQTLTISNFKLSLQAQNIMQFYMPFGVCV